MVTVFTPSSEEWNQGIIGLKDMHGNVNGTTIWNLFNST